MQILAFIIGAFVGSNRIICHVRLKACLADISSSKRQGDGNALVTFDSIDMKRCLVQEQYLELSSRISNTSTFFGLGEHASSKGLPLTRQGVPITMWNRDRPSRYPDENLYGSHPYLLELREGEGCSDPPTS
jgi:alpha-glucosidase (family GH31 glycosyl hydrolase)